MERSFPLCSISALITEDAIRRLSLNQTKKLAKRGVVSPQHIKRKERTARDGDASIKRLLSWQKEYERLHETWLKQTGTPEASRTKARLYKYEETIDNHIEAFGIRLDNFSDGYFPNPKARIRIERDEFHPKHADRLSENGFGERQKRNRLKRLVASYHSRISDLQEEITLNEDNERVVEDATQQIQGLRALVREKNREINRL